MGLNGVSSKLLGKCKSLQVLKSELVPGDTDLNGASKNNNENSATLYGRGKCMRSLN